MHCKFVFNTEGTFLSLYLCAKARRMQTPLHTDIIFQWIIAISLSLSGPLSLFHVVHSQTRNRGMPVDQFLSKAVICLAPVSHWVGRWDRYPYSPSGLPGMDEMRPRPCAEPDQGITVLHAIPAAQLFLRTCQIMRVRPCDQHWHPSSSTFNAPAWYEAGVFGRTGRLSLHIMWVWLNKISSWILSVWKIEHARACSHFNECTGWCSVVHSLIYSADWMPGSSGILWRLVIKSRSINKGL